MPLYDYQCKDCGHSVEVMHGVTRTDRPDVRRGANAQALLTPTILFKGSGWAKKDRGAASSTRAAAASGSKSGDSSEGSSSGGASDGGSSDRGSSDSGSSDRGSSDSAKPAADTKASGGSKKASEGGKSSGSKSGGYVDPGRGLTGAVRGRLDHAGRGVRDPGRGERPLPTRDHSARGRAAGASRASSSAAAGSCVAARCEPSWPRRGGSTPRTSSPACSRS